MPSSLFIISGPSGSGQDSIIEGLARRMPIERIITTTTREPRPDEGQGNPYYFISEEAFRAKLDRGEFVEYARHYNGNWYGVSREEVDRVAHSGKIGIWKIDYQGVITVKRLYPEVISLLVMAPSLEILEKRLRLRDAHLSEAYIRERMEYTEEWLKHTDVYDYTVANNEGELDRAIDSAEAIIRSHSEEKKPLSA